MDPIWQCHWLLLRDRSVSLFLSTRPHGLAPLSRKTVRSRAFAARYCPRRNPHVIFAQWKCYNDGIFLHKFLHPEYSWEKIEWTLYFSNLRQPWANAAIDSKAVLGPDFVAVGQVSPFVVAKFTDGRPMQIVWSISLLLPSDVTSTTSDGPNPEQRYLNKHRSSFLLLLIAPSRHHQTNWWPMF